MVITINGEGIIRIIAAKDAVCLYYALANIKPEKLTTSASSSLPAPQNRVSEQNINLQ